MRSFKLGRLAIPLLFALAGCATTSAGLDFGNGEGSAELQWHSRDDVSGFMATTLDDGRVYRGHYLRITPAATPEQLAPLFKGWTSTWHWRHWQAPGGAAFLQHYDSRVLANLATTDGRRMRCRLTLDRPPFGMSGGGAGECETASGRWIQARFPPARAIREDRA